MRKEIDPGVMVETDEVRAIAWSVHLREGQHVPFVRVERVAGRSEIHVEAGPGQASHTAAEKIARERAGRMIAETMGQQPPSP